MSQPSYALPPSPSGEISSSGAGESVSGRDVIDFFLLFRSRSLSNAPMCLTGTPSPESDQGETRYLAKA